jgi:hypothetical protein
VAKEVSKQNPTNTLSALLSEDALKLLTGKGNDFVE